MGESNDLRTKYRNNLLNGTKTKKKNKKKKKSSEECTETDEDDDCCHNHPKYNQPKPQNNRFSSSPVSINMPRIQEPIVNESMYGQLNNLSPSNTTFVGKQFENNQYQMDNQSNCNWALNDDCHSFARYSSANDINFDQRTFNGNNFPIINGVNFEQNSVNKNVYPTFNAVPFEVYPTNDNNQQKVGNLSEIQQLRQQNEILMQRVSDQQRQIEYLHRKFKIIQTIQIIMFHIAHRHIIQ